MSKKFLFPIIHILIFFAENRDTQSWLSLFFKLCWAYIAVMGAILILVNFYVQPVILRIPLHFT